MNSKDPITKIYLVYVKAEDQKDALDFEKVINEHKVVKGWLKTMWLKSNGNASTYTE